MYVLGGSLTVGRSYIYSATSEAGLAYCLTSKSPNRVVREAGATVDADM